MPVKYCAIPTDMSNEGFNKQKLETDQTLLPFPSGLPDVIAVRGFAYIKTMFSL